MSAPGDGNRTAEMLGKRGPERPNLRGKNDEFAIGQKGT